MDGIYYYDENMSRRKCRGNRQSLEAFETTDPGVRSAHYYRILEYLEDGGIRGLTNEEYCKMRMLHPNDTSCAFTKLKADGVAIHAGRCRPTRRGKWSGVLVLRKYEYIDPESVLYPDEKLDLESWKRELLEYGH